MANFQIISVGWKAKPRRIQFSMSDDVTFYALVVDNDNPDFRFSLELSFLEMITEVSKYHKLLECMEIQKRSADYKDRADSINIEDLKDYYFNVKRLALAAFEDHYRLNEEAKKAVALSPSELSKLEKFVVPIDRDKPLFFRRRILYDEVFDIVKEGISSALIKKYPILKVKENIEEFLQERYLDSSYGFFEADVIDLIWKLEKAEAKKQSANKS